jgi:hypothetical protein
VNPILIPMAAALLTGCAGQLGYMADRGADVSDEALVAAEWGICRAASVGSVLRRYGTDPERMAAWQMMCLPALVSPLGGAQ